MAAIVCIVVLISGKFGNDVTQQTVRRVVYTSEDLTFMRNTLQYVIKRDVETIPVSSNEHMQQLLSFHSVSRYDKGYLLSFEEAVPIIALQNGLIVFTGHTRYAGKTISVLYDEGTSVTYGYVDQLSLLPYTSVAKGDVLAIKEAGELYIQIEQRGKLLNLEQTLEWLKQQL